MGMIHALTFDCDLKFERTLFCIYIQRLMHHTLYNFIMSERKSDKKERQATDRVYKI